MDSFWAMGGYGIYIWPAYAAAFLILGAMTLYLILSLQKTERQLRNMGGDRES